MAQQVKNLCEGAGSILGTSVCRRYGHKKKKKVKKKKTAQVNAIEHERECSGGGVVRETLSEEGTTLRAERNWQEEDSIGGEAVLKG